MVTQETSVITISVRKKPRKNFTNVEVGIKILYFLRNQQCIVCRITFRIDNVLEESENKRKMLF
jgi:hypothetical protein